MTNRAFLFSNLPVVTAMKAKRRSVNSEGNKDTFGRVSLSNTLLEGRPFSAIAEERKFGN
jgi:hypothetical protein